MGNDTYVQKNGLQDFLTALENEMLIIVYDLETTGLSAKDHRIIQVSARLCLASPEGLSELGRQNWYINPGYALPALIVQLTGITDEFLADKPSEADVFLEIMNFFSDLPVMGYCNKRLDDKFMAAMYQRYGAIFQPTASYDVYNVVKKLFTVSEVKDHKLATITEYIGAAKEIEQFHNAEGDTMATVLVANHCVPLCHEALRETVQDRIHCKVSAVKRWEHPKNPKVKRIYVETDLTTFFFDVIKRTWHTSQEDDFISQYDMDDVFGQVLQKTGCADEDALTKWKG